MREKLYDIVDNYIENETNYLLKEMACCGYSKRDLQDVSMLENMTEEDKYKIVDSIIINYDLEETIDNMIHEIIYG